MSNNAPHMPSIMDPTDFRPAVKGPRFTLDVPPRVKKWWKDVNADPARRKKMVFWSRIGGGGLLVGSGVGAYFAFRPAPMPDYDKDPLDAVFNYTLLTDEFNRLPIEERMKLLGQVVDRLKNMSAGESALLAGFAAGIAGAARQQLEENGSRLMIDAWDKFALQYKDVPKDQKDQFLEKTFVDFEKMMEAVGGKVSTRTDEQRIADVKAQAARDRERLKDPSKQPPPEALGTVFAVMNNRVGSHASPVQKTRGQQMIRDMARHFRGQDVETGKPKGPG